MYLKDGLPAEESAGRFSFIFGFELLNVEIAAKQILPAIMHNSFNRDDIATLAGLVVVLLVSLFTPKPDPKLGEKAV